MEVTKRGKRYIHGDTIGGQHVRLKVPTSRAQRRAYALANRAAFEAQDRSTTPPNLAGALNSDNVTDPEFVYPGEANYEGSGDAMDDPGEESTEKSLKYLDVLIASLSGTKGTPKVFGYLDVLLGAF